MKGEPQGFAAEVSDGFALRNFKIFGHRLKTV
jgi:hypothetical protein